MPDTIRAAVIGYGPMHHFGWAHSAWIDNAADFELVGVCDIDPERTEAAKADWPDIETWNDTADLFARDDIDLVSVVTPHFTHAPHRHRGAARGEARGRREGHVPERGRGHRDDHRRRGVREDPRGPSQPPP